MKCRDFEQPIYLYTELTAQEKKAVDTHVLSCESCRELLADVQQMTPLISQAASLKPQPENFGKLTSTIMQAVADQQKQTASWLSSLFVKYAMVAASLILVVWFIQEQQTSVEVPMPVTGTIILNSQPVSTKLKIHKEKPTSLYACAKSENCNNTLVSSFKQKRL